MTHIIISSICSDGFGRLYMLEMEIAELCNVAYMAGSLSAWRGRVWLEIQGQEQMEGDREHENVCGTSWPWRAQASDISTIEDL